mmetsp:Transcript_38699/g.37040  ORF Transcript_38699/g.37040 Transcript_38699/m.37040 type:complete len:82 (+) Transcript_38699:101-346(+)
MQLLLYFILIELNGRLTRGEVDAFIPKLSRQLLLIFLTLRVVLNDGVQQVGGVYPISVQGLLFIKGTLQSLLLLNFLILSF